MAIVNPLELEVVVKPIWISGTAELAQYLGMKQETVKNYVRIGILPKRKLGRKTMFKVTEIEAAISPVDNV